MGVVKGFTAYAIDSGGNVVGNLGPFLLVALDWLSNKSTTNIDVEQTTYKYFSFNGWVTSADETLIGNAVSDYWSETAYQRFLSIAPLTVRKPTMQYQGYRVRLTGNSSGYYAESVNGIGSQGYVSGDWRLYAPDGTQVGRTTSAGMFHVDVGDIQMIMPHSMYNGAILGTAASIFDISFNNQTTNIAHCGISNISGGLSAAFVTWFNALTQNVEPSEDPYDNLPTGGDEPLPGGGAVGIPGFPGLTATSAGVIGLFTPSATQMQLLADFMWTDFGGTGTTVEDILKEVVEALKRSISNPLDYIIGLNIIPSQGLSVGAAKVVRFGFISSGVSMPQLANQYFTVDCGTLSFDTVCGDTFLDYAPYSKFSIYLPYIGFKDVDPNDFVGHTIGVVYHGDCVTGGVTAYITKDGTVMYQYSGCCALNVPLSADNWGETISAAINVATGIVAAAATGGAAGLAQGALKGAASVAANPSLLSPQVSHSGAVSGGAGCMGVQYPFVIREAVNFHSTAGFNKSTGYPAYYYRKLGDVTGFTTVIDAHLSDIPMATQDEIAEIESLLESGVIL